MTQFDWPAMMQVGLRQLGLRPVDFWDLTPAELLLMSGLEGAGAEVFSRGKLAELTALYPDTPAVLAQGIRK